MKNNLSICRTALLFATLVIAACGGSSGGSSTPIENPDQQGAVGIVITDAPSDRFEQILATISRIELLGDNEPVVIFAGLRQVDLQQLTNFSELFAGATVDTGAYNKLRLTLADLELVDLNDDGTIAESIHPTLPGNGEIDIEPNQILLVTADAELLIEMDFDASKSFKYYPGNDEYHFRPVIFLRALNNGTEGRLSKIFGRIGSIGTDSFELCPTELLSDLDNADDFDGTRCVEIVILGDPGIFSPSGDPTGFGSIMTGELATVTGYIYGDEDSMQDPAPQESQDNNYFTLNAVVIELGAADSFVRPKGTIQSYLGPGREFDLLAAPAQGYGDAALVTARLQYVSRIYSRNGVRLGDNAIFSGFTGQFDGVFTSVSDAPDELKTALAILDIDAEGEEFLHGEILTADEGRRLILATDTGDQCVDVPQDTDILLVTLVDGRLHSETGIYQDLQPGLTIDAYGKAHRGCFIPDAIIADQTDAPPPPSDNQRPVADAGTDLGIDTGTGVMLDGTGSSDPDSDPLSYSWTLDAPTGSSAILSAADTAMPSFIADVDGVYVAILVVSDGDLTSTPDAVTVTASATPPANQAPVASAGGDKAVATGTDAMLDGTGSNDPNGDTLNYSWTLDTPAGSSSVLSATNSATPSFTTDVDGVYVATLVVNDGELNSAADTVTVTASAAPPANQAPVANAGSDRAIDTGTGVTLNGAGSNDPDNDPLSYSWSLTRPGGSSASLSGANTASPSFTPDVDGDYVATLVVDDGELGSAPDTVTVTAATPPPPNQAPAANAGTDLAVDTGVQVTLNGAGSNDPDSDPLSYSWSLARPGGSSASLSGANTASPSFTPDVDGVYVATLIVNDGTVNSSPDSVTVTATVAAIDGAQLYAEHCSLCHRALADSKVAGSNAGKIQSAIDDDKGGMGDLWYLTTEELQAIADVL